MEAKMQMTKQQAKVFQESIERVWVDRRTELYRGIRPTSVRALQEQAAFFSGVAAAVTAIDVAHFSDPETRLDAVSLVPGFFAPSWVINNLTGRAIGTHVEDEEKLREKMKAEKEAAKAVKKAKEKAKGVSK